MPVHWIVDVAVDATITLASGETLDRDSFYAWLWDEVPGLVAIDEGAVSAAEAAAHGLAAGPLVIDAAAAPADRDWVGGLQVAPAACFCVDEQAARFAARLIMGVGGCRVRGVRADVSGAPGGGWRESFGPIEVAGFGVVRPAWDDGQADAAPGRSTIFIEPGVGFGTGLHETTQLCLAALARWRWEGGRFDRVLDFGCGSGILGIAAAVCGAGLVDAIEIDPLVHEAIRANARRNGVAARVRVAAALADDRAACDFVVANIVGAVLLEQAEALCGRVRAGGGLAVSGLRAADLPAVADCYAELLGRRPEVAERGAWRCLVFAPVERAIGSRQAGG